MACSLHIKSWWEQQSPIRRERLIKELGLETQFPIGHVRKWVYAFKWPDVPLVIKHEIAGKLGYLSEVMQQMKEVANADSN